jgi:hypothetical protein
MRCRGLMLEAHPQPTPLTVAVHPVRRPPLRRNRPSQLIPRPAQRLPAVVAGRDLREKDGVWIFLARADAALASASGKYGASGVGAGAHLAPQKMKQHQETTR